MIVGGTAMGWDLEIAEAKSEYLTETDLWRFTQQFLMNTALTTTYKHMLMKVLLECTTELNDSDVLTFQQISKHVTKMYWNLIVTHGLRPLNQAGKMSSVGQAMLTCQSTFGNHAVKSKHKRQLGRPHRSDIAEWKVDMKLTVL